MCATGNKDQESTTFTMGGISKHTGKCVASKRQELHEAERRQQRRVDVGAAASTSRGGAGGPLDPTEEDPHSPALDPRLETEFYSAEMGLGETPTATPSRLASGGMHVAVASMAKFGG